MELVRLITLYRVLRRNIRWSSSDNKYLKRKLTMMPLIPLPQKSLPWGKYGQFLSNTLCTLCLRPHSNKRRKPLEDESWKPVDDVKGRSKQKWRTKKMEGCWNMLEKGVVCWNRLNTRWRLNWCRILQIAWINLMIQEEWKVICFESWSTVNAIRYNATLKY